MKIVAKPINVIAVFNEGRRPVPRKFRYEDDSGTTCEVTVDKVNETEEMRIAGIDSIVYRCQSEIGREIKLYELKFVISSYSWELYKI